MRILIVASGNHYALAPFVTEQAEALIQEGNTVEMFLVKGHGVAGYLKNFRQLKETIARFGPDIVHAHYGLCGLLCTMQRRVPVVITYHGSDVNDPYLLPLSRIAMRRSAASIFVSQRMRERAGRWARRAIVTPCGVNFQLFPLVDRAEARRRLGLQPDGQYVLFGGSFGNVVKNALLALDACSLLPDAHLLELHKRTRKEVALLMNACDALLLTSFIEGSPQVVKEALVCNLPVVSVDVGDVAEHIERTHGGVVVDDVPEKIAAALAPLLEFPRRTDAREKMSQYDNRVIAERICNLYNTILHE